MASIRQSKAAPSGYTGGTDRFVRLALNVDAVVTGVNGLGYVALAPALHSLFGFSTAVQYPVGVFLIVYAIAVLVVSTRSAISRAAVVAVITLNALWFVGSIAAAATDALSATAVGTAWLILQGIVVGLFAVFQYIGLRRM